MCKEKIIYNRTRQCGRMHLPDIPEEQWCDFRRDYESGMTYKQIGEKYFCDSRTVRSCIMDNKPSSKLGSQTKPTKIEAFAETIDVLFREIVAASETLTKKPGICAVSKEITAELRKLGYTGSERLVRNYLNYHYRYITDPNEAREDTQNAKDKNDS